MSKCAIVIATYNRAELFERILKCVYCADYSGYEGIDLVISIDHGKNYSDMLEIANKFEWKHGRKTIVEHAERLGLRKHFIFCGDLTQEYGPVIFLEDDVVVNREYYKMASQLTDRYIEDDSIVGASLYSLNRASNARRSFVPLDDGNDVYFCGLMSWAPVYFPNQWKKFSEWLLSKESFAEYYHILPENVQEWPETSFKKLHILYMMLNDKYFVYLRNSCATNFSEPGEHYSKDTNILQVPLMMGKKNTLQLPELADAKAVYDAFMELSASTIIHYNPDLNKYDFDVDLYGTKRRENISKEYVLTCKEASNTVKTFGRKMTPHELNVVYDIKGDIFKLCKTSEVNKRKKRIGTIVDDIKYDNKGATIVKILVSDFTEIIGFIKARLVKKSVK